MRRPEKDLEEPQPTYWKIRAKSASLVAKFDYY
jgi:hypothetical protein